MKKSNNKGITLIALVITILVLLILAVTTLNFVLGNNGIISKAQIAKDKTHIAEENEKQQISELEKNLENYKIESNREDIKDSKIIWSGLANEVKEYELDVKNEQTNERYDCMDFKFILVCWCVTQADAECGTMLIPTNLIKKESTQDWALSGYSDRYTQFSFKDNKFAVKTILGYFPMYITTLIGFN